MGCDWRFSARPVDYINSYHNVAECYKTRRGIISRNCSAIYLDRNRGIQEGVWLNLDFLTHKKFFEIISQVVTDFFHFIGGMSQKSRDK